MSKKSKDEAQVHIDLGDMPEGTEVVSPAPEDFIDPALYVKVTTIADENILIPINRVDTIVLKSGNHTYQIDEVKKLNSAAIADEIKNGVNVLAVEQIRANGLVEDGVMEIAGGIDAHQPGAPITTPTSTALGAPLLHHF